MKIEIKEENYIQLLQCVYLGNLIVNGYAKTDRGNREFSDFTENVLRQAAKALPDESAFAFEKMPVKKSDDRKLSDLKDLLYDSVKDFYAEHLKRAFSEIVDSTY